MKRAWRRVVKYESCRYYKVHGDSVVLTLECGHKVGRKASECRPTPKKVICGQCELAPYQRVLPRKAKEMSNG